MQEDYFRFCFCKDNHDAIKGKYIFHNLDNKISNDKVLQILVFHFIANYNLSDLELFFRLAGFMAFTEEEFPNSIVTSQDIILTTREHTPSGWFGGFNDEEKAKAYIESELGEGIISKFEEIKRQQLLHKKVQVLEGLKSGIQDLENTGCEIDEQIKKAFLEQLGNNIEKLKNISYKTTEVEKIEKKLN